MRAALGKLQSLSDLPERQVAPAIREEFDDGETAFSGYVCHVRGLALNTESSAGRLQRLIPLRDARRAVAKRLGVNVRGKAHLSVGEDPRVHDPQVARDARPEAHVGNDVALSIETGRNLDQLEALGTDTEHGALRDEQRDLPFRTPHLRAVTDLLELRHELPVPPLLADHRLAFLPHYVDIAGGQRSAEYHALRVLADVDEASNADDLVAEAADVDVSLRIDLGEGKKREIQPTSVVEIELRGLLDHRREVLATARVAACDRRTADDALLVGEVDRIEQTFLGRNRGKPGGHS